jgi:TetR/AcrR family transcriptional repressor of bet genes
LGDTTVARIGRAAGVSPALVHHYFSDKDALLAATMRALLVELRRDLVQSLARARTPRERIDAVIDASFGQAQFRPEVASAWLCFWSAVPHQPALARLQRIYAMRLRSHLVRELRRLLPEPQARRVALGTAALIDGLFLGSAVEGGRGIAPAVARALAKDYVARQLGTVAGER